MIDRWRDEWMETHRRESEQQIARLAMQKAYRRYQWWEEQKPKDEWQEEQDNPGV